MRSLICNKILQAASYISEKSKILKPSQLLPFIKVSRKTGSTIEYHLELEKTGKHSSKRDSRKESFLKEIASLNISRLIENICTDDTVTAAYYEEKPFPKVTLKVCQKKLIRKVLQEICDHPDGFWKYSPLLRNTRKQKVLVEFSSPNIAKPFHVGHLRSTIVGNFIANLTEALGHDVVKINYLGDWGMQFGLLKYGYDLKRMSEADLKNDPIRTLYSLYVWVNEEAEKSPDVLEEAKRIFLLMEKGSDEHLSVWHAFRDLSIRAYDGMYQRLNVFFDEYHGESMYNKDHCESILRLLKERGFLTQLSDGRKVFLEGNSGEDSSCPALTLVKSDGSTLYLTRDVAAALHRFSSFAFDRMLYVVDGTQRNHFAALKRILTALGLEWASNVEHVPFGRVLGMSTRKGTVVFLEDVLDQARDLWMSAQEQDSYTEFDDPVEARQAADISAVSTIAVEFLRRRRGSDFTFSWEDTLKTSGVFSSSLQYTHCRLLRLERNCGVTYNDDVTMETLVEPEVTHLLRYILRFDEVLLEAYEGLESSVLVHYLRTLSNAINSCYGALSVNTAPLPIAQERLKLFRAAKHVLAAGMRILGLKLLEKM